MAVAGDMVVAARWRSLASPARHQELARRTGQVEDPAKEKGRRVASPFQRDFIWFRAESDSAQLQPLWFGAVERR